MQQHVGQLFPIIYIYTTIGDSGQIIKHFISCLSFACLRLVPIPTQGLGSFFFTFSELGIKQLLSPVSYVKAIKVFYNAFQEAIENTIGSVKPVKKKKASKRSSSRASRPALGQLMSDKLYLENLLKNPDLAIADKKNDIVMKQAQEAIRFLENREEFWRQQQTAKRH